MTCSSVSSGGCSLLLTLKWVCFYSSRWHKCTHLLIRVFEDRRQRSVASYGFWNTPTIFLCSAFSIYWKLMDYCLKLCVKNIDFSMVSVQSQVDDRTMYFSLNFSFAYFSGLKLAYMFIKHIILSCLYNSLTMPLRRLITDRAMSVSLQHSADPFN